MKISLKYMAVTTAAVFAVGALLLWDDFTSKVIVHNLTSHDLIDVETGVGSEGEANLRDVFWRGNVKRGQSQYTGGVASHSGGIAIRMKRAGEPLALYYGYVSGGLSPGRVRVCVWDAGDPEITKIPPFLGRFSLAISPGANKPPTDCRNSSR